MDGHVLLQQGERHLHVGEPGAPHRRAARRLGLRRARDDRLVRRPRRRRADEGRQRAADAGDGAAAGGRSSPPSRAARSPEDVLDRNVARDPRRSSAARPPSWAPPTPTRPTSRPTPQVGRDAAAQGMVLLRNDGRRCRSPPAAKLALFGNTSYSMITGGTGSGDVNEAYTISLAPGPEGRGAPGRRRARRELRGLHRGARRRSGRPRRGRSRRSRPIPERRRARRRDRPARAGGGRWRSSRSAATPARAATASARTTSSSRPPRRRCCRTWPRRSTRRRRRSLVVLNIGGVIETASWRDAARRHPARLAAGAGGGPRDRRRADRAHAALGQARDHVPDEVGGRALVGQLPRQDAAGAGPECRDGPVRRGDRAAEVAYDGRHLGRLPSLRHEGREDRVSLRLRPVVHRSSATRT